MCKSIGVSNFNIRQLKKLLEEAEIPPAVNQVELHPYLQQHELVNFCKDNNIHVTAYSPLGSPNPRPSLNDTDPVLMLDPVVLEIAKKHNKSPAQILIRFHIENGLIS